MAKDPMHKTVCDRCYRPTWYETEGPCRRSVAVRCDSCHQTTGEERPCGGTLRVIDRSGLSRRFAHYHETQQRIRVRMADGEVMTGTVGKTTGWRPSYMLMRTANARGSSWLLSDRDIVVAVKIGSRYVPTIYCHVWNGPGDVAASCSRCGKAAGYNDSTECSPS